MKGAVKVLVITALGLGLFQSGPVHAEDERGRWSFAIGLGMHSTFDDIRSNAAEVISIENDPTGTRPPDGDLSNDKVVTFDPRQDDELARATKVEEKQRFDLSAAYGLTSWLSLQVDTGLYQGDVAPLDVLKLTERWVIPVDTRDNSKIVPTTEGQSVPITVGRLTQIPFSVNAVVRFRRDSPFNPFLGLGVGYMFNSLNVNDSFNGLNNDILRGFSRVLQINNNTPGTSSSELINLQEIYAGFIASENSSSEPGGAVNLVYIQDCTKVPSDTGTPGITNTCTPRDVPERYAAIPTQPFIHTNVQDGFLYQFSVGADYHLNERWSAYVSARYLVTDSKVSVRIQGSGPQGAFNLQEATFRYTAETNPPAEGQGDNRFLVCTPPGAGCSNPSIARPAPGALQERVLVQGGDIGLSAFTLGAGIRFTF